MTINNEHKKLNAPNKQEQNQTCLDSAEREGLRPKGNVPNLRFPEFQWEWEKCKLGELTTKVGSGSTPKGGNAVYTPVGRCFVRSQNVGMGYLLLDDIAHINEDIHQKHKATELNENDVLLNITGASIGRTAIATKEIEGGNVNQHVCIIRANSKVSPKFLCNYIQTKKIQKYIQSLQTGGSREGLNFEQIRSFPISLPSIAEQNKIAQLLDKLNERIATQSKIIEDLKKLKCAIAERLFKVTNGDVVILSDVCNIQKGKQVNGDCLSENGTYYVMNGGTEPSGYYEQCNTPANTISISEGGNSCGYVQYNRDAFWSGGHCYSLTDIQSNVCNLYLYHYLKSKESAIMKLRIGTGLPNIQKKDLEKFAVLLPPVAKQVRISTFLTAIERKTTNEEILLSHFQEEKQYLLRQMFI